MTVARDSRQGDGGVRVTPRLRLGSRARAGSGNLAARARRIPQLPASKRSAPIAGAPAGAFRVPTSTGRIQQQGAVQVANRHHRTRPTARSGARSMPRPYPWYAREASEKRSQSDPLAARQAPVRIEILHMKTACGKHPTRFRARGEAASSPRSRTILRTRSARGVPPGSRRNHMTAIPREASHSPASCATVDLPAPSMPSRVMNRPVIEPRCASALPFASGLFLDLPLAGAWAVNSRNAVLLRTQML